MTSPNVTIYRNGDPYFPGARLVVNKKQIRTFDCLLDKVTQCTRSRVAVRSICTPNHGRKVNDLEQLESGGVYVALGRERFKKLEYNEIQNIPANKRYRPQQLQQPAVRPVIHSRVVVSARCKKAAALEPLTNKIIHVYRNGDTRHPGTKLLLNKRLLCDMEKTLQYITDKVNLRSGAVRGIYTVDGHLIHTCDEIQSGLRYVAVGYGSRFIQIAYTDGGMLSLTPQRAIAARRINGTTHNNIELMKGHDQPLIKRYGTLHSTLDESIAEQANNQCDRRLRGKKNIYNADNARRLLNGDHQCNAENESKQEAFSIEDEDRSGVYKASGEQQVKGQEIKESERTVVEKPLDMMLAQQVEEEFENKKNDDKKDEDPRQERT